MEQQGTERHTERSKMRTLQNTLTTLSYLKHKGDTVISDTTKQTRGLCQFMNTGFVSKIIKLSLCVHMNRNSQMSYFHGVKTNCSVSNFTVGTLWLLKWCTSLC